MATIQNHTHARSPLTRSFADTKVRNLTDPVVIDEHVIGLEIPVQDMQRMQVGETIQDLPGERLDDALLKLVVSPVYGSDGSTRNVLKKTDAAR